MTPRAIALQRLRNQRLIGPRCATPEAVIRWFGAVQSQDYGAAKWAVAQRTPGATNAGLDALYNAGAILRTHVMRPTWHFVLPPDIRWLLQITGPRVKAAMASGDRKLGLDAEVFARGNALIAGALEGGNDLTRAEIAAALAAGGIVASDVRLVHLMMRAELDGIVCSGPLRGKQFTYALLDERVPATRAWTRDEALAELATRYFTSHGPATVQDFAWWSGLTVADARAGIAMATPTLREETVAGKTYWFPEPAPGTEAGGPIVHLLPNFDEHFVAYTDRSAAFDPARLPDLGPKDFALLGNTVVLNGQMVGGWRRTIKRNEVVIETALRISLTATESAALQSAVDAYGRFMGLPASLVAPTASGTMTDSTR
jgi:hypothetical protein